MNSRGIDHASENLNEGAHNYATFHMQVDYLMIKLAHIIINYLYI